MSIKDFSEKIKATAMSKKPYFARIPDDIYYGLLIILVAFASFGLGRLSRVSDNREPVRILGVAPFGTHTETQAPSTQTASAISALNAAGKSTQLVGSKNGTKYHYPWCAGASQISEQNKIYFSSQEEAQSKGYTPASNCKGL